MPNFYSTNLIDILEAKTFIIICLLVIIGFVIVWNQIIILDELRKIKEIKDVRANKRLSKKVS